MKNIIFILLLILSASCQESKETPRSNQVVEKELPPGNIQEERAAVQTPDDAEETKNKAEAHKEEETAPVIATTGRYKKLEEGEATNDCNCQCVDIDFDQPTEWCIIKDKVYITARCRKTGDNSAELYFVNASRADNPDRPIPWEKFDTSTPIASINFKTNGTAEVDWIGFSVNGEVSTYYAIYGKKTIEGTYKKE